MMRRTATLQVPNDDYGLQTAILIRLGSLDAQFLESPYSDPRSIARAPQDHSVQQGGGGSNENESGKIWDTPDGGTGLGGSDAPSLCAASTGSQEASLGRLAVWPSPTVDLPDKRLGQGHGCGH